MRAEKPICSLSLDLDNKWSYLKTHGDAGWESFPSYLDLVVPRFLRIFREYGWMITVFVVGQDAALERNREALQMIADAGHEIGNHSFSHEPWLHLYSKQRVENEIIQAEEAIEEATGYKPRGFRGPGYSLSRATLEVLAERRYIYDASTLPTYIGPLARAYYFMTSSFSRNEKSKRKALFGTLRDGRRPLRPYVWTLDSRSLLEIPVTTMPFTRIPIHFSYVLYLAKFSFALAQRYFRTALALCTATRTHPSLLLHPLDFLSYDDVPDLTFFPAMTIDTKRKLWLLEHMFSSLAKSHKIMGMIDFAERLRHLSALAEFSPKGMHQSAGH
jgi:peptidoglycan/xylan/chitin deacetylase (PgdA/CDA1 family)